MAVSVRKKVSRYCSFGGCKNNSNCLDVHFYRFPKEEQRCQIWVKTSRNAKLVGIPAAKLYCNAYLCSDHFEDWCFMNPNTKHSLVHNAVPNCAKPDAREEPISHMELSTTSVSSSTSNNTSLLEQLLTTSSSSVAHITSEKHTASISFGCMTKADCSDDNISDLPHSLNAESPVIAPTQCSTPTSHVPTQRYRHTPRKAKLALQIKRYRDCIRQLRARCTAYRKQKITPRYLKSTLTNQGVDEKLATFIQRQIELSIAKTKQKRYTEYEKIQAFQIYSKSRAAYRVLQKMLQLPSERTLQRFLSSKLSSTGLNTDVVEALKKELDGKANKEKMFALIFDEMSLKPCLVYDKEKDKVIGFEDYGGDCRTDNIANQALVLMLRSLTSKKKLPLGFYFSKHSVRAEKLKTIILGTLTALQHTGAIVKVLICDQGVNNSVMFSSLGVKKSEPFFWHNGQKIYCIFDPPHLLKSLRRGLMKFDLKTDKGLISFKHIRKFYEKDQDLLVRCAPKLTDRHIYDSGLNSMKVSLAAQVFSHTVAAGMNLCILSQLIEAQAAATVEFIQNINCLFDSLSE